ncbi:hypothetical protein DM806_00845 [Sphingobium lactosutens]|uniref:hypothetical protein n=1 Tax=Sphingobium lactosutens TaxID=522773 RepID=UPI0015BF7F5E|nr:hypothetical protein [Sphingobium lactosutens]NWK94266.1 hypothetical protein [Sphingobium lactosutens]
MARQLTAVKWTCLLICGASATIAASEPRRRLSMDFDEGQAMASKQSSTIVDARSRQDFRATIDKGTKAADRPQIVSQGCHTPPSCLRVSLDPSEKGAAKNKIMYSFWSHYKPLPGGEGGRIVIGDGGTTRIRFSMKLDNRYDTPLHQMIHFQIFQPAKAGGNPNGEDIKPGGPVVSLRIVPVSRRKDKSPDVEEFIIAVRNPGALNYRYYDTRDPGVLYRGTIRKGEWNSYSFVLQSARRGGDMAGRIGFWLNDQEKVDKIVPWGFNPAQFAVSPQLGAELGSYRSADVTGHQTVYFDDVTIDR